VSSEGKKYGAVFNADFFDGAFETILKLKAPGPIIKIIISQ